MIDIQWKGKIGYGDIVSPICYAYNVSYKLQTEVNLTFRWSTDSKAKIHPDDSEPLWHRASFINALCERRFTDVSLFHRFEDPLDCNHTNYDWDVVGGDKFHNYWYPMTPNDSVSSDLLVVNTTIHNTVSLKDYGKPWKDPIADRWNHVISILQQRYRVVAVNYRTPIKDLIFYLREARGFVGYHGTAAWVAKFMHTPSIIFADGGSLTRNAFPYAYVTNDTSTLRRTLGDIDTLLDKSRQMIDEAKEQYKTYHPSDKFIEHLDYDRSIQRVHWV